MLFVNNTFGAIQRQNSLKIFQYIIENMMMFFDWLAKVSGNIQSFAVADYNLL
mgnify:FL=1